MSKIKVLLRQSIKERTLLINVICYWMFKVNICSKYTAGLVSMDYIFNRVKRKYKKKVKTIIDGLDANREQCANKTVWIFWWQGVDNAPNLVKACLKTVQKNFQDWDITVVDQYNYKKYVILPQFITEKHEKGVITHTHFSDILRVALLVKYGGLWLDATVYCTGTIEKYMIESDLFVYRNGWMDQENISFSSWLIYAKSNEPILSVTYEMLCEYWKKNNHLAHYFLLHMFVRLVCDQMEGEWSRVPYYSHIDNHLMAEEILRPFNQERFNDIIHLTHFHKLSNKIPIAQTDENSLYQHIIRESI